MDHSVPSSPLLATSPPPWHGRLLSSFDTNYTRPNTTAYLSMSKIRRDGEVSLHCLPLHSFVNDDPQLLEFLLALNDSKLMGDIKSDPHALMSWIMPKTNEHFTLRGKFYIASAPSQVTRHKPPRLPRRLESAAECWEEERMKQWQSLTPETRSVFTWPPRGETPRASPVAFSCKKLDYIVDDKDPIKVVHDIALDNFCLLLYKVTELEHVDFSTFPNKRVIYSYNAKDGSWSELHANP